MSVATKQKPKVTISHRRRTGSHQKHKPQFVQTYWPYLPLGLIVAVGILLNSFLAQSGVLSYATNMSVDGLLANTNSQRTQNGLGGLGLNGTLSQAAQAKANDMITRNYWSHNTPDGQEPWVFIVSAGYSYQAAGENLAYGFADSAGAVIGWMNSPGHRANVLNTTYTEVGFGIANGSNFNNSGEQTLVVAMYAKPTAIATAPAPAPATPAPSTPTPKPTSTPTENNEDVGVAATVTGDTEVSRIEVATSGSAPWSVMAGSFVAVILLLAFVTRHGIAWHRMLIRGEKFVLKHKVLDIVIVSSIMLIFILSQTVGVIQ